MTRSWIAAALLAVVAGAGTAAAEGSGSEPAPPVAARPARIPYRVVKLMPESSQALVYDRSTRAHLVVAIGDDLGDFQVIDVDDEELVLWRDGREVVLVVDPSAPSAPAVLAHRPPTVVSVAPSAPPAALAPEKVAPDQVLIDPYAASLAPAGPTAPAAAAAGPLDPYAELAPVTAVSAAPTAPATVVSAAAPAPAIVPAVVDPNAPHVVLAPPDQRASLQAAEVLDPYAEPKVVAAPAGAEPIKGVPAPTSEAARAGEIRADVMTIQRAQLQDAVTSFDKLAKDHGFEKTGRGVRVRQVAPDSYAYGLGLRAGDIITAIDGAPLRGLDDAASAYVRLDTATSLRLDIERAGARGTLRFALR